MVASQNRPAFSTLYQKENNSFTFLRLLLALTVVGSHAYVLGAFGDEPLARLSHGTMVGRDLAVEGFFIISGYLLTNSLLRNPSLSRFWIHRVFRIFPGYWVALLLTSFAAAPLLFAQLYPGKLTYSESITFDSYNAIGYLAHNSLLWQGQKWILPLFLGNPTKGIVNGSLWSLFYELLCYGFLALAAVLGLLRRRRFAAITFSALYLSCVLYRIAPFPALSKGPVLNEILNIMFHPSGPCIALAFAAGVLLRTIVKQDAWQPRLFWLALATLTLSFPAGMGRLVWPLALPYLLVALAERLPFGKLERFGDLSYGVYIYSFLIQQSLVALGWSSRGFYPFLALSFIGSLAAGAFSWFAVERFSIRFGHKLAALLNRGPAGGSRVPDVRSTEINNLCRP